jgi:hypothetical protein
MGPFFVTRDVPDTGFFEACFPDAKTAPADNKNSRHAIPLKKLEYRLINSIFSSVLYDIKSMRKVNREASA